MSWQLAAFALLCVVVVGGFAWYERERPSSRLIALVAALAALAVAGRLVLAPVPNVVATTDIALITGYALGGAPGFAVGALAAPISNIWLGQGPWTVWQMCGWGLAGLLGAWLALAGGRRRELGRLGLACACAAAGFAYGALLDLSVMVTYGGEQSLDRYLALSARGLPFNIAHAAGNFAIALAAGPALVRMLVRARTRFEFTWRPAATVSSTLVAVALAAGALSALWSAGAGPPAAQAREQARASATASARSWLVGLQNPDGGFGASPGGPSSPAMTGWVMLGLEAAGRNPLDVHEGGETPVSYLREQGARLRSTGDLERTILALEAAGIDSRRFAGTDLVAELRTRRDGDGSVDGQTNLTTFYVLAMRAAGVDAAKLSRPASWLRRVQSDDGGWGFRPRAPSDPDSTGAVLQALAAAGPGGGSVDSGLRFLRRVQQPGGGFALSTSGVVNSQSTAWATQGLIAGGEGGGELSDALRYLDSQRESDGHFRYSATSDQTSIWVTAQVLLAIEREPFPLRTVARAPRPPDERAGGEAREPSGKQPGPNPGSPSETQARGDSSATEESERSAEERNAREGRDQGRGLSERRTAAGEGRPDAVAAAAEPVPPAPFIDKSPPETAPSEDGGESSRMAIAAAIGVAALLTAGAWLWRRRRRA